MHTYEMCRTAQRKRPFIGPTEKICLIEDFREVKTALVECKEKHFLQVVKNGGL